jgi:DNA-binding response OmpR family regulator
MRLQSGAQKSSMIAERKILIVDDDDDLRHSLKKRLAMNDEFAVLTAETAAKGIDVVKNELLDLVVLDVGLPDMDGREMCKHLRNFGFKKPIVMVTGKCTDADQILGFDSGANDYITRRPFRFAILLARIRAQLRQHEDSEDAVFAIGFYSFKPASKTLLNRRAP